MSLYENINKRKKLGKSRSKAKSTISPSSYKNMQAGFKKKKKVKKSMTNKSVDAPKGFHWMKSGKSYKLMKGDYKPHKNAVKKASFSVQAVHKK